jgi:signal transduction histidine kinase
MARSSSTPVPAPRFFARRTVVLYLLGIVVPAVVLLFLAWRSIDQQRAAMAALSERNLHLNVERLALDAEQRVGSLAGACAQDGRFRVIAAWPEPEPVDARRAAADILASHPIAAHVFLSRGDLLRYPVARAPLMKDVSAASGPYHEFAALIAHAEQLEREEQRERESLALYQRAATLRVPPALHALALARIARCNQNLGRVREASDTWIELASSYRDERDLLSLPYGLIAAVELPPEGHHPALDSTMAMAYEDLTSGHWTLAAEQVEYFLPVLEQRLGRTGSRRPDTPYLQEQRFARAISDSLRALPAARPAQVSSTALGSHAELAIAYTALDDAVAGCALNLDWVERAVLAPLAARAALGQDLVVRIEPRRASATLERAGEAVLFIRQPFAATLRDFDLVVRGRARKTGELNGGTWAFAGATAVTIGALAFGVFLLLRDVARQRDTNRLREDLVSAVSHELKTPLTLIRVYAETLAEDPGADEAERGGYYRIIVRESERLGGLIDRVLSFSRVDRGQRTYRMEKTSLGDIVRQTVTAYAEFLQTRGFVVSLSVSNELPPVPCDRDAVAEALVNLLDNAAKYSGEAREIAVAVFGRDRSVVVEVADHGIGIDHREQALVFNRFYRSPMLTGRGGYGLGLYLVKHIADAHGGAVELDSAPGQGSRFRLVLPVAS